MTTYNLNHIPDGWEVYSGTWGTDMHIDDSYSRVGNASLQFTATTPASDPAVQCAPFIIEADRPYRVSIFHKSASGSSVTWKVYVDVYDENLTLISSITLTGTEKGSTTIKEFSRVFACDLTTYPNCTYGRVRIAKNKDDAYAISILSVSVRDIPCMFHAYSTANQTMTAGAANTVVLGTEKYDVGSCFTSNTFTAKFNGIYNFGGCVAITDCPADSVGWIALYLNGSPHKFGLIDTGHIIRLKSWIVHSDIQMLAGDQVNLVFLISSIADVDTEEGEGFVYFYGHEIY